MSRKRTTTKDANTDAAAALFDAVRENLSPQAVAAITAYLYAGMDTKDPKANREVAWLANGLLEMLGDEYARLLDEIGL